MTVDGNGRGSDPPAHAGEIVMATCTDRSAAPQSAVARRPGQSRLDELLLIKRCHDGSACWAWITWEPARRAGDAPSARTARSDWRRPTALPAPCETV